MRCLESCTSVYVRRGRDIGAENRWLEVNLPRGPAAVLAALHLCAPRPDGLDALNDQEWREAVEFADRSGLTLVLRRAAGERFPQWLRHRTDQDLAKNRQRVRRTEALYRAIDQRLQQSGIEYLALKGLTQCLQFPTPADDRVQFDVDIYVPREHVHRAGEAVRSLGFEPIESMEGLPTDHLPTLIQKNGWEWRGDYFDPALPLSIDVHFQFWSPRVERIAVPDVESFWRRRTQRRVAGIEMPVLCAVDALGYTALHLLRHVLRGSARPFHIYETAGFLDTHAADEAFWREWRRLHSPEFRRLQAVMFHLAAEWFGCELGSVAAEAVEELRPGTKAWFDQFALSPARAIFHPQKDELWLHWSLLDAWRDKLAAARLRLLPLNLPGPVDAVHVPSSQLTLGRRVRCWSRWLSFVGSRALRHGLALPHAVRSGIRWWRH